MDGLPQPAWPACRGVPDGEAGTRNALRDRREDAPTVDRFVATKAVASLGDVTPGMLDEFLGSRPRKSARSYNHLQGTVRRLLDWMAIQGIAGVVRYRGHPRREAGRRTPVLFSDAQVRQLLDAAAGLGGQPGFASLTAATYRTAFAVLYCLGLRVGEVSRLQLGDMDLSARTLIVRRTKFGNDRLVPFGPRLARELGAYLAMSRRVRMPDNAAVFPGVRGAALSTNSMRRVFSRLCREVGIGVSERAVRLPGCTTCGTASQCRRWCTGTSKASIPRTSSCSSRPSSVTRRSRRRRST